MSNKFYVYELWNPITNLPFYVGKGSYSRKLSSRNRLTEHLYEAKAALDKKRKRNHKINTILKILRDGYNIIFKVVFESDDEDKILLKEKELIKLYGRRDNRTGILTNLTDGGEGVSGFIYPEWMKKIIGKRRKGVGNGMFGRKHSEESKKKMSDTKKENVNLGITIPHTHTEEHKQKLRNNNPGGKATAKPILQLSKKHVIIKRYKSGNQAAKFLNGSKGVISFCARNYPKNSAYGYYWIYEEDYKK